MYGSEFHYGETLAARTQSSTRFERVASLESIPSVSLYKTLIVIFGLALSAVVFAAPSEPKFPKEIPPTYER